MYTWIWDERTCTSFTCYWMDIDRANKQARHQPWRKISTGMWNSKPWELKPSLNIFCNLWWFFKVIQNLISFQFTVLKKTKKSTYFYFYFFIVESLLFNSSKSSLFIKPIQLSTSRIIYRAQLFVVTRKILSCLVTTFEGIWICVFHCVIKSLGGNLQSCRVREKGSRKPQCAISW